MQWDGYMKEFSMTSGDEGGVNSNLFAGARRAEALAACSLRIGPGLGHALFERVGSNNQKEPDSRTTAVTV
jgi:hypothetical protein